MENVNKNVNNINNNSNSNSITQNKLIVNPQQPLIPQKQPIVPLPPYSHQPVLIIVYYIVHITKFESKYNSCKYAK